MSNLVTTVVSAQAGGAAVVIGTVVYALRKFLKDKKAVAAVEKVVTHDLPEGAKTAVEDAVKFLEHIVEAPVFAPLAAKGKIEADHLINEVAHDKAVIQAQALLKKAGGAYSALSPELKVKVESALKLGLMKIGVTFSDAQVKAIFADADAIEQALASDKTVQALLGNDSTPAQPAQA